MLPIDVSAITSQVQSILDDPHREAASTGTPSLDAALALLRQQRHSGQTLEPAHALGFWYAPPKRAHVHG